MSSNNRTHTASTQTVSTQTVYAVYIYPEGLSGDKHIYAWSRDPEEGIAQFSSRNDAAEFMDSASGGYLYDIVKTTLGRATADADRYLQSIGE